MNDPIILSPKPFSAKKTFDCGQCFRFREVLRNGVSGFEGISEGNLIRVEETDDSLLIFGADRSFADSFFALQYDYEKMKDNVLSHSGKYSEFVEKAWDAGQGIRILHQNGWEALITFILSQNNNIPRITKLVDSLCTSFGEKAETEFGEYHLFPTPEALFNAGEAKIAETRCGFRAKYIMDAAAKVLNGEIDLEKIKTMSTEEAIEYLCRIKGVGIKVASCTLLFGFEKYDAFPVDVWMKKVIERRFDSDMPDLGEFKGIAQQFLFFYERYIGDENG